ncbi:MAG: twin-arginine translocase subunit TatC [Planctomycetes bacterium]|nr:twin-arginine translocase subunit TatC [Planctomycetota bacterium]
MLKSTLALKKSDDLFEKSSMSFGEHLEELRTALIRAAMWLMGGLILSMPLANRVVEYMQIPLQRALDEFQRSQSLAEMTSTSKSTVSDELKAWMEKNNQKSQIAYIDSQVLKSLVQSNSLPPPPTSTESAETTPSANLSAPIELPLPSGVSTEDPIPASTAPGVLPKPSDLVPLRLFLPIKSQAETFNMQEGMLIWFKAALMVAVIIASPGIFYHLWGFISAGLYPHERRYVYFFLPISVGLFWIGALFCFFVVFELVISFLLKFNAMMGVGTSPRLNEYMGFALMLPLGFGVSFQLPLVMLVVERLGMITVKTYLQQWRMAIFVIAVVSMILTPADLTSMIAMAVPLIVLYFLGIALCHYLPRSNLFSGTATDPR